MADDPMHDRGSESDPSRVEGENITIERLIRSLLEPVADCRSGPTIHHRIAGSSVAIDVADEHAAVLDAISHLRLAFDEQPTDKADLTIDVRFGPHPPWLAEQGLDRSVYIDRDDLGFHIDVGGGLSVIDKETSRAVWWFDPADAVQGWHTAAPLRQIFHWHMLPRNRALLHAAAIAHEGRAALITGPGGSGKSTTSLTCYRLGLGFIADDYCVVEPSADGVMVHGLYRTAKASERTLELLPWLRYLRGTRVDQHKRAVFLPDALGGPVPVVLLMVGKVDAQVQPSLRPVSSMTALAAAGPTSVLQQRGSAQQLLRLLSESVRRLPCAELTVSQDLSAVGDLVRTAIVESP